MIEEGDLYAVLRVARGASAAEVRASWQRLALQYHPDKQQAGGGGGGGGGGEVDEFVRISAAWQVLGDAQARAEYDKKFARLESGARHFSEKVSMSEFVRSDESGELRRLCRCGDYYELFPEDVPAAGDSSVLVQCNGCTLYVTVLAAE